MTLKRWCVAHIATRTSINSKSTDLSRVYQTMAEVRNQLDEYLAVLSRLLPVDLMPGDQDLSSAFIPQSPMPKFIFPVTFANPKSKHDLASLTQMASNPHSF